MTTSFARLLAIAVVVVQAAIPAHTAAEVAEDDNRYESPTFGYTLEWDDHWSLNESGTEGDFLVLESRFSFLGVVGTAEFGGDAGSCIAGLIHDIEPVYRGTGSPVKDKKPALAMRVEESSHAAVVIMFYPYRTGPEPDPEDVLTAHLECLTLIPDEVVLLIIHLTTLDRYPDELEAVEDVLDSLEMPEADYRGLKEADAEDGPLVPNPVEKAAIRGETDEVTLAELLRDANESLDKFWAGQFDARGEAYQPTGLELFTNDVSTPCGAARAGETGTFYCTADERIYVDLPYSVAAADEYDRFVPVFLLAREWGHHLQRLLGLATCPGNSCDGGLTIRAAELQADCLAGAWAGSTDGAGVIDGDGADAALSAFFDDEVGATAVLRGSGSLRTWWFLNGYEDGVDACFDLGALEADA